MSPTRAPTPSERLAVIKTFKLFIGGQFPRSESGRSMAVHAPDGSVIAHACQASRKDLRDAVSAARSAFEGPSGWPTRTPYNRGQVLYRLAEMLEGKRAEMAWALGAGAPLAAPAVKASKKAAPSAGGKAGARRATPTPRTRPRAGAPTHEDEVAAAIDRLVIYAGWADKFAHVLGGQSPVAGPYYTFSAPEPVGVVAAVGPDVCPLLSLVSLIGPALCAGNTLVALASESAPLAACVLGEACVTSDLPPGVVNILTGRREELLTQIASHRDIDALVSADLPEQEARALRAGSADNLKRVRVLEVGHAGWFDPGASSGPPWIEAVVEAKTIWQPMGA